MGQMLKKMGEGRDRKASGSWTQKEVTLVVINYLLDWVSQQGNEANETAFLQAQV